MRVRERIPHTLKIEIEVKNGAELEEALAAGARGFVAKPFLRADLLSTVLAVLDQESTEPQPSP
jgi:nicotinate-nucleotide pyrophosphorylase